MSMFMIAVEIEVDSEFDWKANQLRESKYPADWTAIRPSNERKHNCTGSYKYPV